jgi:hypothetical protein
MKDIHQYNNKEERTKTLNKNLKQILQLQMMQDPKRSSLKNWILQQLIEEVLQKAKNGSTTGLDRCLYELWKTLSKHPKHTTKNKKTGFNRLKVLTTAFQDIQNHGVNPRSDFTDS